MEKKQISTTEMTISVERKAVAKIESQKCVNCGSCREVCPVDAIEEQQRTVCRICPSCAPKAAVAYADNDAVSVKEACTTGCPLGISPQGYVNLTRLGMYEEAYQLIWKKNPLPSICSRICHHPCEQACKRETMIDSAVSIRGTKRFLCDNVKIKPKKYPVMFDEEIAVIGAGPAGLAAAHKLSLAGYKVTIFESQAVPGGMMSMGIPKFRLSRDVIKEEVAKLEEAGITIKYGQTIGKKQMESLKKEYDAVLVAAGTTSSKELKIDGWRKEGVYTALQFTKCIENDEPIKRHPGQNFNLENADVVVIGGGNVALDCARTAIRMGAKSAVCTCLESGADVPCHEWERMEAEEEGITILEGWAPVKYTGVHNELTGVEYKKVVNFRKEDGKICFDTDATQTMELKADWVVVAIGQASDGYWSEYYEDEQVFFAGDVKNPVNSVVDAMASGQAAAKAIDEMLRGRSLKDPKELRILHQADMNEKVYPATLPRIIRPEKPIKNPEERIKTFDEIEYAYTEEEILLETKRCMQCGFQKVNPEKCIGCGACVRECPKGDVITLVSIGNGGV